MRKKITFPLLFLLTNLSFSGNMGTSQTAFSGFWMGIGGSYSNLALNSNTTINQVSSSPTSAQYLFNHDSLNHLAPIVDLGYYFPVTSRGYLGPKFLYKYIGQQQLDETWSGSYSNGSYQTGNINTKNSQNLYLLLSGAFQLNHHWLLYAGGGPGWAITTLNLNGSTLPASQLVFIQDNLSQTKAILGGAGQVGFEYLLPYQFMVDISYNFLATPRTNLPEIIFQAGSGYYSSFSQNVSVVEQGINITVNKYLF